MNLKVERSSACKLSDPVHYLDPNASDAVAAQIRRYLPGAPDTDDPILIVCIGTDRSTGDALGPLVGTRIEELQIPDIVVYGTLEHPVHAVNLTDTLMEIRTLHPGRFTIAVDACLGRQKNIGNICVAGGPLLPGAGVNKRLEAVGQMNITGLVNVSGFMEYSVLQSTRLNLVIRIADVIGLGLQKALLTHKRPGILSRFLPGGL
ncbi:spore protease YyaC [Sporolactobacillus vineae]|uniref:spore protease YyaC n=1 Tax=Sporolactobacillus vineae TaxID=444463 RepID=UPI000288E837|nr:spore protease YyaC [Sporolactobacillus vineae]